MKRVLLLIALAAAVWVLLTAATSPQSSGSCTVSGADAAMDASELRFLHILNAYRSHMGVAPLTVNPELNNAAAWKARDMAANSYIRHTDSTGRNPFQLQDDCGYTFNTWRGENLAVGYCGLADYLRVFIAWQRSPGHNDNMLREVFNGAGIGKATGGTWGCSWALELGGVP